MKIRKRQTLTLAGLLTLTVLGLGFFWSFGTVEIFTDSTGIEWRVLAVDENENRLIITERVQGISQYNTTNVHTFLGQSDGLRLTLDAWFADVLAPELVEGALTADNLDNDVRLRAGPISGWESWQVHRALAAENAPAGLTRAGESTSENPLFVLSVSEVNEYRRRGTLNKEGLEYFPRLNEYLPISWWLRSHGTSAGTVAIVRWAESERTWFLDNTQASDELGFRPAMWVRGL